MTEPLSACVVAGGPSSEAEVSRVSARAVAEALSTAGHAATVCELDAALARQLLDGKFDVVFPAVHGPLGEDGCLQGLLEVVGLPYVGSGVLASALAANKPFAKRLFVLAELPVADGDVVTARQKLDGRAAELRRQLGQALVVKPAGGGSAIGVTRVRAEDSDAALVAALERALEVDDRALVEQWRAGREVTCAVLEDELGTARALAPTLIVPKAAEWYDFTSRYATGGSVHYCPAPFSAALTRRIQEVAEGAHSALGARDLSRVDFVVDDGASEVTLLEVNTLPGMTATSLFPEAAAQAGIAFVELCDLLLRRAWSRGATRRAPSAVSMPGAFEPHGAQ